MVTVYVIEGIQTHKRYVGITNDLDRRLSEHRQGHTHSGHVIGAFRLLHTERYPDHRQARTREKFLKSGQGREWLAQHYPRSGPACGG